MHYAKPSFWSQLASSLRALHELYVARPRFELDDSCVVVVLDAIDAYAPLFPPHVLRELCSSLDAARAARCPVVFTRWARYREVAPRDEIDLKGHWSFYVPPEGRGLLVAPHTGDVIVDVRHTNAFVHDEFARHVPPGKTLVLMGGWAESCVINTVRAALDRDRKTVVVRGACTGHFGACAYAMYVMQLVYTRVVWSVARKGSVE